MILKHGLHLAYCTNIHRGETWAETLHSLENYVLRVKHRVLPHGRYAIGLRLSDQASRELSDPKTLLEFRRWLDRHDCYVFTINGFPFGRFHGERVKEKVYLPDWTDPRRLAYTTRLFDLLAQLLPAGLGGSVSTLPGSFKDFITSPEQERAIRDNLWRCVEHIAATSERTNHELHLGVEPEPFGWFENTAETVGFFDRLHDEHPHDQRLDAHLGVNYDTCHFAAEYEEPANAIDQFRQHGIRLSKIHLSNALKLHPGPVSLKQLAAFADDVYLHQTIVRDAGGALTKFRDLGPALRSSRADAFLPDAEWRVHFHVPLYCSPVESLDTTSDHISGLVELLQKQPHLCSQLEMETYTWAVLPEQFRNRDVTDQLVAEYGWTLQVLRKYELA